MFLLKRLLNGYKDKEVKTFLGNLHLRWVPVRNPAFRSLFFPLITIVGIAARERGITCTQEINKQSWSNYPRQD
jgi:hypothetical protein